MLHSIEEFHQAWTMESGITLKVLKALTDQSLGQAVAPGGRTLGRLAWHTVLALPEMGRHAGLEVEGPPETAAIPRAAEMVATYERCARSLGEAIGNQWTDEMLADKIPMYGEEWTRAQTLMALIAHQTHHRGQMTVLMRQAGLAVPGVYGPSREEWAAYGMPAQD
ncbi:MAG: DinB family protein [Bacteroidales bacterium]